MLPADVNAKNSFGGYVGYKPYHFSFYNGILKNVYAERDLDSYGNTYMAKIH